MSAEPRGPAVVAFGAGDALAGRDISDRLGERLWRVVGSRRASMAASALAAVAGCGSLVAPWYSVVLPMGDPDPGSGDRANRLFEFHVAELDALGTGYLMGLLILAVATVLALFGPPAARPVVRLSGLTVAGVTVATLVASAVTSGNFIERSFLFLVDEGVDADNRSGLTAAFLAVALAALALFLTGRTPVAQAGPDAAAGPAWGWQPPRSTRDETAEEIAAAAPLDLTVQPARPFTLPDGDDDRTR